MKLDFSRYHPLDHWPGTAYCRGFYGGLRHHLSLAWEYHRRDQLLRPLRRLLYCTRGLHAWQVWYQHHRERGRIVTPLCRHCPATRLPSEAELEADPLWG